MLDWLVPPGAEKVVDLAAGTGALTELLVARVPEVTAVEPDPAMRAVLADAAPGATVVEGTAEAIPLGDEDADAVFVSSAWHWFDPVRAGAGDRSPVYAMAAGCACSAMAWTAGWTGSAR